MYTLYIRPSERLGNAAVLLVGGTTRDVKPLSILLRSGDVVVMAGPWCRRAYHGMSHACRIVESLIFILELLQEFLASWRALCLLI